MSKQQHISLVLGSGGARGLAHIGVIRVLERHGWKINAIAGSSMGALIGGFYAAGKLDAYADWVLDLTELNVMRYLDPAWGGAGLIKGEAVMETLREFVGEHRIEDLPIPLTIVATDPRARREVWLNRGDLFDAIRASIAIPTIFTPHVVNGRPLLDGGILNPVPIAPIMHNRGDLIVAVTLSGTPREHPGPLKPIRRPRRAGGRYRERIDSFLDDLQKRLGLDDWQEKLGLDDWPEKLGLAPLAERRAPRARWSKPEQALSFVDTALLSLDAMQAAIARNMLAAYPPDLLIEIPINVCAVHEFYRAAEVIPAGEYWAEQALSEFLEENGRRIGG
ncbi:MAG: serine protease [Gammaproteobacteria bacterium]|nr:MAG: serine protease [Gammaproteobacteria bacterium]